MTLVHSPWRKSSFSADYSQCVEVADIWHKSSYSVSESQCVEAADSPVGTAVRDSKHPTRAALFFTRPEWTAFLHGIKQDEF